MRHCCFTQVCSAVLMSSAWQGARLVQDVGPIGACQYHDALCGCKAIHLHQQLVERVLPLIVAACKAATPARPANGVNLICKQKELVFSTMERYVCGDDDKAERPAH